MAINSELPKKWSRGQQGFVVNDDWLLRDLKKDKKGAQVNFAPGENKGECKPLGWPDKFGISLDGFGEFL